MKSFAHNEMVQQKFIESALSRSVLPAARDKG